MFLPNNWVTPDDNFTITSKRFRLLHVCFYFEILFTSSVMDPGFPEEGANSGGGGVAPTYKYNMYCEEGKILFHLFDTLGENFQVFCDRFTNSITLLDASTNWLRALNS